MISKGNSAPFVFISVAFVLLLGLMVVFGQKKLPPAPPVFTPKIKISPTPSPITWHTYQNKKFNFQIDLPSSLSMAETDNIVIYPNYAGVIISSLNRREEPYLTIHDENGEKKSFTNWIGKLIPKSELKELNINNNKVYFYNAPGLAALNYRYVFTKKNGFVVLETGSNTLESDPILSKIVNSFIFLSTLPSPTPISSLQTYQNDKYGISFQYPSDWKVSLVEEAGSVELAVSKGVNMVKLSAISRGGGEPCENKPMVPIKIQNKTVYRYTDYSHQSTFFCSGFGCGTDSNDCYAPALANFFPKMPTLVDIGYYFASPSPSTQLLNTLDQIVQSFKSY